MSVYVLKPDFDSDKLKWKLEATDPLAVFNKKKNQVEKCLEHMDTNQQNYFYLVKIAKCDAADLSQKLIQSKIMSEQDIKNVNCLFRYIKQINLAMNTEEYIHSCEHVTQLTDDEISKKANDMYIDAIKKSAK